MSYGTCKKCGCMEHTPCIHPDHGACWWVDEEHEMCSHCYIQEINDDPATERQNKPKPHRTGGRNTMKIPQKYLDAIGTDQTFEGAIFGKKLIPETTFKILDVRFGHGYIIDMQKFEAGLPCQKHPTIEFLVKNKSMPRSRWTTGFPCREIDINNLT